MTETKQIQGEITNLFNEKLKGGISAKKEWRVTKERTDGYDGKLLYAPIIDIGIEPFLIHYVTPLEKSKLEKAFSENKILIEKIKRRGKIFDEFEPNMNPRCLIAIEIETSGSRKHLLGDIINASIFGKIGLIVPTNEKNFKSFERIMEYLQFAQKNKKIKNKVLNNVILIKSDELIEVLKNDL